MMSRQALCCLALLPLMANQTENGNWTLMQPSR